MQGKFDVDSGVRFREECWVLGIDPSELRAKDREERVKLIKRKHRRLALQYHPDRNPAKDTEVDFIAVQDAYEYLISDEADHDEYRTAFDGYFPQAQPEFDLNNKSFDLRLEVLIREEYEDLMGRFNTLETEDERQAFVRDYREFVAIARQLDQDSFFRADMSYARLGEFQDLYQHFLPKLKYFWRNNMLTLFGEELLPDFVYREALGYGHWRPVLAYRKLFNPVKLAAALLLTAMAPVKAFFFQYQVFIENQYNGLKALFARLSEETVTIHVNVGGGFALEGFAEKEEPPMWRTMLELNLRIFAMVNAILLPIILQAYIPNFMLILSMIPLVNALCFLIACPNNQLLRPFLNWLKASESIGTKMAYVIPLLLLASVVGLGLAAPILMSLSPPAQSVNTALIALYYLSSAYTYYAWARLNVYVQNVSTLFGVLGWVQLSLSLLGEFFIVNEVIANIATYSLSAFSGALLMFAILTIVTQGTAFVNSLLEKMCLPTEPVADAVKNAVNPVVDESMYSQELFNTPEGAKCLSNEQRTFWRQTQSFFGVASKPERFAKSAVSDVYVDDETVSLLAYTADTL